MAGVALGCSVGTGWVVTVALVVGSEGAGPGGQPSAGMEVVDRRRVELVADPERFAYHAAAERPIDDARALVEAVSDQAARAARGALADIAGAVAAVGHHLSVAAVVGPAEEHDRPLESVLASHSAIHTAEGRLYRTAVRRACRDAGARVVGVARRELVDRVAEAGGASRGGAPDVVSAVAALGRTLGPPWRREHKDATLAAWLALVTT